MSRTTASQRATEGVSKTVGPQDDEGESLSAGTSGMAASGGATSRWRTQLFALQCLHRICVLVSKGGQREHLDMPYAVSLSIPTGKLLVSRVPDLIKMAFTASTAYVTEIRLEGLTVLRDVVEVFARSPDPDYPEALLLEQHQAPITAALTPAFSSDSTPEIISTAVQVCATFIGCGVVKDVARMGRILRLLTMALEQSNDSNALKIGDIRDLSPNANAMLRISTLAAWAELQVARSAQPYLVSIIEPHRTTLSALWIASLRDYAGIKGDSEVLQESTAASIDNPTSGMGREVLLPYYSASWWKILKAVASLMAVGDSGILAAMDGLTPGEAVPSNSSLPRDEPTAYFFVIFGLVFEALASTSVESGVSPDSRATLIAALETLKYIVQPEYSGGAVLDTVIADELMSLLCRMIMTETAAVQVHLIAVTASLASSHKKSRLRTPHSQKPADTFASSSQCMQCLRICAYALRHAIPAVSDNNHPSAQGGRSDRVALINSAVQGFLIVGDVIGPEKREEVRASALSIYADLLKDEKSEFDVCRPTLPSLKTVLDLRGSSLSADDARKYERSVHGFLSACLKYVEEMRGRQGPGSVIKVNSNLHVIAFVLTTIPPNTKVSQAVLDQACYLLGQALDDFRESSTTAAYCTKTLVAAASSGDPTLTSCVRLLMPPMVRYVARVAAADEATPDQVAGVEEIVKAFAAFFGSVDEQNRIRFLGLLLPLLILLLDPTRASPAPGHTRVVTQLVELATLAPAAFKDATAKLGDVEKEVMETSIRQAITLRNGPAAQTTKKQISLRSF